MSGNFKATYGQQQRAATGDLVDKLHELKTIIVAARNRVAAHGAATPDELDLAIGIIDDLLGDEPPDNPREKDGLAAG